jgi:hypothetical protein
MVWDYRLRPVVILSFQIRKSEKNLLEKLFTVIHHLTPAQMEALLKEEDSVVQRRAQVSTTYPPQCSSKHLQ